VSTLNEFAKNDNTKTGYKGWKELTPENQEAWAEAIEGYQSGIGISTIVRWLQKDKDCPLTSSTIRSQLKASIEHV
tara:strand:+ start:570 stop:797 length:228 start_codon:yes stop_codon:yes gene_type:complete